MDILIISVAIIFGYLLGEAYATFKIRRFIIKLAKDNNIDLEEEIKRANEEPKPVISKLYVEEVGSSFLLYDFETNSFIAQAKSLDELAKIYNKNAAVKHYEKWIMFHEGSAKELKLYT